VIHGILRWLCSFRPAETRAGFLGSPARFVGVFGPPGARWGVRWLSSSPRAPSQKRNEPKKCLGMWSTCSA